MLHRDSRIFLDEVLLGLFPDGLGGISILDVPKRVEEREIVIWPTHGDQVIFVKIHGSRGHYDPAHLSIAFSARRMRWRNALVVQSEVGKLRQFVRKDTGGVTELP